MIPRAFLLEGWRRVAAALAVCLASPAASSYAVSLGLHGVMLLACLCFGFSRASVVEWPHLTGEWAKSDPSRSSSLETAVPLQLPRVPQSGGTSDLVRLDTLADDPALSQLVDNVRDIVPHDTSSAAALSRMLTVAVGNGRKSNGSGSLSGNGQGSGTGGGSGNGVGLGTFFGVPAGGKSVVYVVDCSLSMNAPYRDRTVPKSPLKTRFIRLQEELIRSIGSLPQETTFFVIFFNHDAHPMPAQGMQIATNDNKERWARWVAGQQPNGDTNPKEALALALLLKPETIYLLTDGHFMSIVEPFATRLNAKGPQATIHTIGFGANAATVLLERIAEKNNGQFVFVP